MNLKVTIDKKPLPVFDVDMCKAFFNKDEKAVTIGFLLLNPSKGFFEEISKYPKDIFSREIVQGDDLYVSCWIANNGDHDEIIFETNENIV